VAVLWYADSQGFVLRLAAKQSMRALARRLVEGGAPANL
jgi:hypothetical protein